eukprot:NODE_15420_length_421_cov_52.597315_g15111_i0.p1 GENE.NODE_15420_length_421_cov_52.597315_g15111_i0~~NODE_15420_length_421_cov_52.597315_g15111_i0.p1  ORF type:complete len:105 (+),score=21.35 NODE_15420_length_421_cov_52.597315_g15111_i0:32-316(+)
MRTTKMVTSRVHSFQRQSGSTTSGLEVDASAFIVAATTIAQQQAASGLGKNGSARTCSSPVRPMQIVSKACCVPCQQQPVSMRKPSSNGDQGGP